MRWASSPISAAVGGPPSSGASTPGSYRPKPCPCRPASFIRQLHLADRRPRAETPLFQTVASILCLRAGIPQALPRKYRQNLRLRIAAPGFLILLFTACQISPASASEPPWVDEFHELCGQTHLATGLTDEELSARLARCDRLARAITSGNHPGEKVYLFRLKKCRGFYQYLIDVDQAVGRK